MRTKEELQAKLKFYGLLIVGVFPAVVVGLLAKKSGLLDWLLDSVTVVAITLVLGGVFMLFCDRLFNTTEKTEDVNWKRAFKIGCFQCLSVIPGMSRSMSTIVGGMQQGLTRKRAAEFSFFLAVPTMAGATLLDLVEMFEEGTNWATTTNIKLLLLGCIIAFLVAIFAMKWFVAFLTKYGFKAFGWYRIIVGLVILVLLATGHSLTMVD
jgi:undecaprenyl-diphosphatase